MSSRVRVILKQQKTDLSYDSITLTHAQTLTVICWLSPVADPISPE